MANDTWRGHPMHEAEPGVWVYSDTGQRVSDNPDRECGHCGLPNREDGHDACLGELPSVANACCGHGDPDAAYVQRQALAAESSAWERWFREAQALWARCSDDPDGIGAPSEEDIAAFAIRAYNAGRASGEPCMVCAARDSMRDLPDLTTTGDKEGQG